MVLLLIILGRDGVGGCGRVEGRIQLLFVNIQGSINLSPRQVWVIWGRGGHTGPYAAPKFML